MLHKYGQIFVFNNILLVTYTYLSTKTRENIHKKLRNCNVSSLQTVKSQKSQIITNKIISFRKLPIAQFCHKIYHSF